MNLRPTDYAALAQDSYKDPVLNKPLELNGRTYKPLLFGDDPKTGFQATAYDHVNADGSHSVVIAYRGSEFKREPLKDGGADAGMVLGAINAQGPDSIRFTEYVMDKVGADAKANGYKVDFTVTGHSLGGTLAEINARKFGLKGETFNAYGAAGLIGILPGQGKDQVIDWVRATDIVSAASPHFGQVRVVADQQDIDHLRQHGYTDNAGPLSLRDPIGEARQDAGDAHAIANFAPDAQGHTMLSPQNEALARAHEGAIGLYRNDIEAGRMVVSTVLGDEAVKLGTDAGMRTAQATERAGQWIGGEIRQAYGYGKEKAEQGAHWLRATGQSIEGKAAQAAQSADRSWHGFSQRLDHMLQAAKSGDWSSFRQGQQALAGMEPGRQLRETAVQAVNRQEPLAAQQAALATQQGAAPQVYMR